MDRDLLEQCLEGHEDVLTPKAEERNKFFGSLQCPRCGSECRPESIVRAEESGAVLTKTNARCLGCGCLFEPDLGLIIEMGNLAKLEPDIPIIHPSED